MKGGLKFTHYFELDNIRIFGNKTIALRSRSSVSFEVYSNFVLREG